MSHFTIPGLTLALHIHGGITFIEVDIRFIFDAQGDLA